MDSNHLVVGGQASVPRDMHVGHLEELSPRVTLVNLFGAKGLWAPGWYLVGEPAMQVGLPLSGPFDTMDAAKCAFRASTQAYFARTQSTHGSFGYCDGSALVFDPTVILKPENLTLGKKSRVDAFVKLECGQGMILGDYVHIASFCHLGIGGGILVMEEGASAGSGTKILTGSADVDSVSCSATHPMVKNSKALTVIRKNATLFAGCIVLPGAEVGEGARVAAGAVVLSGAVIPPGELWGGVPARRLRGPVAPPKPERCDYVYEDNGARCLWDKGHSVRHFQSGVTAVEAREAELQ